MPHPPVRCLPRDYQTGAWDTDAAEHVAYHHGHQRAYVASAESGAVKVVDMSDPTSMSEIGTLNVGNDMRSSCPEVDCIYERMDFGGRHNPCGYATVLKFVTDYGTVNVATGQWTGASGN